MKKITFISLLWAVVMSWALPVDATDFNEGGITYHVNPDGVSLTVTQKNVSNRVSHYDVATLVVPDTVIHDGIAYAVTKIGERAFADATFSSVTLPTTLKVIEEGAFESCYNLEYLLIPDGVTSIGEGAFFGCEQLKGISLLYNEEGFGQLFGEECENLQVINCRVNSRTISWYLFSLHVIPPYLFIDDNSRKIFVPEGVTFVADELVEHEQHHYNIIGRTSPADITCDRQVDVADVSEAIDLVLGKCEMNVFADVNGDGRIDVSDVGLLIDHILGKD